MNGANGMSDIEGKAAMGSGERGGSRTSFNTDFHGYREFIHFLFIRVSSV